MFSTQLKYYNSYSFWLTVNGFFSCSKKQNKQKKTLILFGLKRPEAYSLTVNAWRHSTDWRPVGHGSKQELILFSFLHLTAPVYWNV